MGVTWDIVQQKTALIVHDMVNEMVDEKGLMYDPSVKKVQRNVKKLIKECRAKKILIAHALPGQKNAKDFGRVADFYPELISHKAMLAGTWGGAAHPSVAPKKGDVVVHKKKMGAFHNSTMHSALMKRGIDTVIITGVSTSGGCDSTARDATNRNRAQPLFKSSIGILNPDPIDNFVLLSLHALKHSYSRTIWLIDLYESLQGIVSQTDGWKKIIERTRYWQQEKIVSYGLMVLEGILGFNIPVRVKEKLKFEKFGKIEKYLLRLRIKGFKQPGYYIALWFLSIKGIRNRLEFLRETAFPQDDTMEQIYLKSSKNNRFAQWIGRMIQSVVLLGNGIKQAFSNR